MMVPSASPNFTSPQVWKKKQLTDGTENKFLPWRWTIVPPPTRPEAGVIVETLDWARRGRGKRKRRTARTLRMQAIRSKSRSRLVSRDAFSPLPAASSHRPFRIRADDRHESGRSDRAAHARRVAHPRRRDRDRRERQARLHERLRRARAREERPRHDRHALRDRLDLEGVHRD